MRRIGQTPDRQSADRLCDYLETQSIIAKVDDEEDASLPHDIWIREERDVEAARGILTEFLASPTDSKFDQADEARSIRQKREQKIRQKVKQQTRARQKIRSRGGLGGTGSATSGSIPVTIAVIVISALASFGTGFGRLRVSAIPNQLSSEQQIFYTLACVDPRAYRSTNDQFASMKEGQIWRVITPMFLHGATFHLAFNMIALFTLGSVVERIHGSWFFAGLLLVSQIGATLLQMSLPLLPLPEILIEDPRAIGASGAVFGVFGFIWIRPIFRPNYPVEIPPINVALMLGFFVLCFFLPQIANGAHLGGLVIGVLVARFWPGS